MMATELSHDAFGRFSVMRESAHFPDAVDAPDCEYCGMRGQKTASGWRLFRYGNQSDGYGSRPQWDNHLFCSVGCYRSYHAID